MRRIINITDASRKSNTFARRDENTNTSLGKYIFLIRDEFDTREFIADVEAFAKKSHGRSPA